MSYRNNKHKIITSILPREIDKANMVQSMKDSWQSFEDMKENLHDDPKNK